MRSHRLTSPRRVLLIIICFFAAAPNLFACSTVSPLDINSVVSRLNVIEDCVVNIQPGADIARITYMNSSIVNFIQGSKAAWVMGVGNSSAEFSGGDTVAITLVNESTLTVKGGDVTRISVFDDANLVLFIENFSISDTGLGHRVTGNWFDGTSAQLDLYFTGNSGIEDPNVSAGDSVQIPALPTPVTNYHPPDSRLIVIDRTEPAVTPVPIPFIAEFALVIFLLAAHNQRIQFACCACPTSNRRFAAAAPGR